MNPRDYGALVQPALWLNLDFIKHMVHTFLKVEFIARWWFHGWKNWLFEIAYDEEAVRKMLLWEEIRGFSGPYVIAVYPINTYSRCVLSVAHPKSPERVMVFKPN